MRLLNTKTFEFKNFFDSSLPVYAILSHRWGSEEDEVSYKQLRNGPLPPDLPGLLKIQAFCRLADGKGFQWAWVDTCCIDKRSSAELSEAINSMFKWYKRSALCCVHLADVEFSDAELSLKRQSEETFWHAPDGWASLRDRFNKSSWFERGWTLQELLAPRHVVFYDSQWNEIGPLEKFGKDVAKVTGIGEEYLSAFILGWPSVATRMSWASRRHTSREEDLSYCLLGIFDINMPLLYGEGAEKAFIRLQTEIIKNSNDESLFAWTSDQYISGILARRPSYFANSGEIVQLMIFEGRLLRPPFSITNSGLEIAVPKKHLELSEEQLSRSGSTVRLFFQCVRVPSSDDGFKPLYVDIDTTVEPGYRVNCETLGEDSTYELHHLNIDLEKNDLARIYVRIEALDRLGNSR